MPVIDLIQGSPAWLDYRKKRIMATDTPCILGSNPWITKIQKWEEKQPAYVAPEMNDAMREGQLKEPVARQLAIDILGINFIPVVYESDIYPWMASSLDGISDCGKYILELKCPSKAKLYDQICENYIPMYYMDQMQHQSATLSKVELVIYGVYYPLNKENPIKFMEVQPDLEKHDLIFTLGYKFYRDVCTMNPPTEWKLNKK